MLKRRLQLDQTHPRRGSMMPAIAVSLIVVGGCLALVLNTYWLADAQEELRSMTQAAVLAGAQELSTDDQLKPGYDPLHTADHVRAIVEKFAAENPVFGGVTASVSTTLYRTEFDPETGRRDLIETDENPDTVVVNARRDRYHGNPVGMIAPAFTGQIGADVGVRIEATVNNKIHGLRPVAAGKIPAWPIAILQNSFDPTVTSWQTVIETKIGLDSYGWDADLHRVTEIPDGLPEMVLNFPTEDIPGNMVLLKLMHDVTEDELIQQTRDGWSKKDLADHQGELIMDQGGITFSATDSMAFSVFDELTQKIGQARIVMLYEQQAPDSGFRNSSPNVVIATRMVAARLMDVRMSPDGVQLIVQPAVVATRTAVIDETEQFNPAAIGNPYIFKLSISE